LFSVCRHLQESLLCFVVPDVSVAGHRRNQWFGPRSQGRRPGCGPSHQPARRKARSTVDGQAGRDDGQAAATTAKPAAAAVLTPADAAPLMGTWQIPLETPTGRLVASLVFRTEAGKVVAGISAPNFKEFKITDITKAGQVVTLKASTDYSGPLASYAGPVTMVLTMRPKGPDYAAAFAFNEFQIAGTAKKKA
jgi:hypothetical protein